MTSNLKSRLICLIKIFNASAKLTCYSNTLISVEQATSIMDRAYSMLVPYYKYWVMIDPKLGVIRLKKDVESSKCSNHGKTCDKVITVNGATALDELENVYNFIKDPANRNDAIVDCYSRVLSNYIRLYRKELNKD